MTFPPKPEPFPLLPNPFSGEDPNFTCNIFGRAYAASLEINPCFNVYHVSDTCPFAYSHLGKANTFDYVPPGGTVYFNRSDVQKAINAPVGTNWQQCTAIDVFGKGYKANATLVDTSLPPTQNDVLKRVIEHTNNTMIGVGNLDMLVSTNGTLLSLQNVTVCIRPLSTVHFALPSLHVRYQN